MTILQLGSSSPWALVPDLHRQRALAVLQSGLHSNVGRRFAAHARVADGYTRVADGHTRVPGCRLRFLYETAEYTVSSTNFPSQAIAIRIFSLYNRGQWFSV